LDKDFLKELATRALEENVDKNSQLSYWLVYDHYEIIFDEAGSRYIHAPSSKDGQDNEVRVRRQPLSRTSAGLFLRFARWAEEYGMDKELDTKRNAEAARSWAEEYGVLGLNPANMPLLTTVSSHRVTAEYLGMPWLDYAGRGYRSLATGGRPHESVANFSLEAWEANIVWRLYESVRSDGAVDEPSVTQFMSTIDQMEADITTNITRGHSVTIRDSWVERDIFSSDPELIRQWALAVVGDAVNRKIENHCYPIIHGDAPGSYEPGWVFKSLLGAMWLQMMFLMREDRRCWWCGGPLDPGRRSHARFCDNNGRCRWNWNYNKGSGKSSKHARMEARYIR
jgi:hypothetical protein